MNKLLFSILAIAITLGMAACTGKAYDTNLNSNANLAYNPLNLLDSAQFNWGGTDPVSASINGAGYTADSASTVFSLDASGTNIITAYVNGTQKGFVMRLRNVYAGNIYNFSRASNDTSMIFQDSSAAPYQFYSQLGNIGQVLILRNDPQRIIGRFQFLAYNSIGGTAVAVTNGWFNVHK